MNLFNNNFFESVKIFFEKNNWLKRTIKTIKYIFINIFLIFKYVFIYIKKILLKLRVRRSRRHWLRSKNRNFYNPILGTTVYKHGSIWKIARYGSYIGEFKLKKDAMDEAFHMWIEDEGIYELENELNDDLANVKQKILNKYTLSNL